MELKAKQSAFAPEVIDTSIATSEQINKLIRNTYTLLSMTLLFSAGMAGLAMAMDAPPVHWIISIIVMIGLLFATNALKNSAWGLVSVFAFTGFMGFVAGPIINLYLTNFSNGGQLVMLAFGSTAVIFLGLSGYALTTKKDFNFMGAFLMTGLIVAIIASLVAMLFSIPGLALAVSFIVVLLMSGLILYDTSEMVHGRETNYIMATVGLYLNIYNLFMSLLHLLAVFMGED